MTDMAQTCLKAILQEMKYKPLLNTVSLSERLYAMIPIGSVWRQKPLPSFPVGKIAKAQKQRKLYPKLWDWKLFISPEPVLNSNLTQTVLEQASRELNLMLEKALSFGDLSNTSPERQWQSPTCLSTVQTNTLGPDGAKSLTVSDVTAMLSDAMQLKKQSKDYGIKKYSTIPNIRQMSYTRLPWLGMRWQDWN